DGFKFEKIAGGFRASIEKVSALSCDMLLSAHPDASDTIERLSTGGKRSGVERAGQCTAYVFLGVHVGIGDPAQVLQCSGPERLLRNRVIVRAFSGRRCLGPRGSAFYICLRARV